jgi:hypothetical protein
VADVEFRDSAGGQIEPSAVRGTGGVVVTGESQRGNAAALPSRLSADELTGVFGPDSELTDLRGVGHAEHCRDHRRKEFGRPPAATSSKCILPRRPRQKPRIRRGQQ